MTIPDDQRQPSRSESTQRGLDGEIMVPGDDGYDAARAVWNAMVDRRPALVVRCASSADVAAAIDFGRRNDLEIGVRCGGHSVLGISVPDSGLMIDLAGLRTVRVDPEVRRASVQGGALRTWTGPPSGGDWRPPRETFPAPEWAD